MKIYNQVEHVLRLAGAVVSFQVAGQTMNVPKARSENFPQWNHPAAAGG